MMAMRTMRIGQPKTTASKTVASLNMNARASCGVRRSYEDTEPPCGVVPILFSLASQ